MILNINILSDDERKSLEKRKFAEDTYEGMTAKIYYMSGWLDCHSYFEDIIDNMIENHKAHAESHE